jgi:hypothetical protein
MNTDSGAWKVRWIASVKTRILRYRKKRVRKVDGYIGGHYAKARHSSILHVTVCATCAGALQAMRQQAANHSRDKKDKVLSHAYKNQYQVFMEVGIIWLL